uniref:Transmembrane protein n=1 Tax=Panagrolaimus sp. JU765 TaxID=591449 RepID=A0AC34QWQ6_9BILA
MSSTNPSTSAMKSQSNISVVSGKTDITQLASSSGNTNQSPSTAVTSSSSFPDPSIARLKIPKNVIKQLEKLVAQNPKKKLSTTSQNDPDAPTYGMKIRFLACILVLMTSGIVISLITTMPKSALKGLLGGFMALFLWIWYMVHGSGLSRQRRAYFNERNVLDTYKIYDREFGHLFQPEADTPGCCGPPPKPDDPNVIRNPVQSVGNSLIAQFNVPPKEKAEFTGAVQDHYGNMYDNIKRINQEMKLLEEANKANTNAGISFTSSSPGIKFIPADIPIPGETPKKVSKRGSLRKRVEKPTNSSGSPSPSTSSPP